MYLWCLSQVPILDINNKSKHIRQRAQPEEIQASTKRTAEQDKRSGTAITVGFERQGGPLTCQQQPEISPWEQSLDAYCYECLNDKDLDSRDGDQVISRYFKNYKAKNCQPGGSSPCAVEAKCRSHGQDGSSTDKQNLPCAEDTSCNKNTLKDCDEILVVSRFWIWVFGGMYVSCG